MQDSADTSVLEHAVDQWAIAWSSGNVDKLLLLFTDDVYYEDVPFGVVNTGKEALRNFAMAAMGAFPGMTFEVKSRVVASNGTAGAFEWIWRGKQAKDFPGLPATNMPFQIRGVAVVEFRDAKISRCLDYWDLTTYMKQVGLIK